MQIAEADGAVLRLLSRTARNWRRRWCCRGRIRRACRPSRWRTIALNRWKCARRATRQDIWFSPEEPLDTDDPLRAAMPVGNGICHAFYVADQLVGTATLGRLAADKPFTAAQVNLLHTFVDFLAIQIVNARLLDERTAARVTRRELEIAADIQRSLLPAQLPACLPFELAGGLPERVAGRRRFLRRDSRGRRRGAAGHRRRDGQGRAGRAVRRGVAQHHPLDAPTFCAARRTARPRSTEPCFPTCRGWTCSSPPRSSIWIRARRNDRRQRRPLSRCCFVSRARRNNSRLPVRLSAGHRADTRYRADGKFPCRRARRRCCTPTA